MYKIKYSNDSFYPDYPEYLKESRSTNWPPPLGLEIQFSIPDDNNIYEGVVNSYIWNETGVIVKTKNDLLEHSLKHDPNYNYGKGYIILFTDYVWNPKNINQLKDLQKKENDERNANQVKISIKNDKDNNLGAIKKKDSWSCNIV